MNDNFISFTLDLTNEITNLSTRDGRKQKTMLLLADSSKTFLNPSTSLNNISFWLLPKEMENLQFKIEKR